MKKVTTVLVILLSIMIFAYLAYYSLSRRQAGLTEIKIGETNVQVEISDTPDKKSQGLSGRESLGQNQGMLFIFDSPGFYSFWMKDMNFALDFIWILDDYVVEINENIKPENYQPPKTLIPQNKINRVLEVGAGFVKNHNIKIGDRIDF